MLKLERSELKTIDTAIYRNTMQYVDVGEDPELEEASVGGREHCLFAGRKLTKLRRLVISSDKLKSADIVLEDVASGNLDVDIDIGEIQKNRKEIFYSDLCESEMYGEANVCIRINAKEPLSLNITAPLGCGVSVIPGDNSAPVNMKIVTR